MRHVEVEGGHLIRLERGEELLTSLIAFCNDHAIRAGTLEGLGALADVTLAFFNTKTRTYDRTELPGEWELVSLFADVALWKDKPFVHTHAVLSGPDCVARGGHFVKGTVSVTAEIRLWTIGKPIRRGIQEGTGFNLLDL